MSSIFDRLAALGLELPPVAKPLAAYVPARQAGDLVYTSGQLPLVEGELISRGKLGAQVSLAEGVAAAQAAALNALAAVAAKVDGLDNIDRILKVTVYVASTAEFTDQAQVANGVSELLEAIFGKERGCHVRSAVGVAVLPLDAPVEVELVVEI